MSSSVQGAHRPVYVVEAPAARRAWQRPTTATLVRVVLPTIAFGGAFAAGFGLALTQV